MSGRRETGFRRPSWVYSLLMRDLGNQARELSLVWALAWNKVRQRYANTQASYQAAILWPTDSNKTLPWVAYSGPIIDASCSNSDGYGCCEMTTIDRYHGLSKTVEL
jgi:hypothetical protein